MNQPDHSKGRSITRQLIVGGVILLVLVVAGVWLLSPAAEEATSEVATSQVPTSGKLASAETRPADGADVQTVAIPVDGMVCTVCTAGVRRNLAGIEGVEAVNVSLADRRAVVQYQVRKISPEDLAERLTSTTGYRIGEPQLIED